MSDQKFIYNTSGTIGDSYIIATKLKHYGLINDVTLNHYTKHKNLYNMIKEVYSVNPEVKVNFVEGHDPKYKTIYTNFVEGKIIKEDIFPDFKFADISKFNLPDNYEVLNIRSGRSDQKRFIPQRVVQKISNDKTIIIGNDNNHSCLKGINLVNKTTINEAFEIIRNAQKFTGYAGVFCFVAMSHKVPTIVYYRGGGLERAVHIRTHRSWKPYLKWMIQV